MAKKKRKIIFVKWNMKTWYLICTRSYISCLKLALKHIFKGNCISFYIKKHNKNEKHQEYNPIRDIINDNTVFD